MSLSTATEYSLRVRTTLNKYLNPPSSPGPGTLTDTPDPHPDPVLRIIQKPHLWGTHPPSLASLIPLADLPVIDTWKNYLAPVHKSQGAGMASSECEPMAAEESLGARRGCSEIKLINGVCLQSLSAVKQRGVTSAGTHSDWLQLN
ncbi:hypothetical protein NQZ68_038504 [Dissostichus eleginoides]|nr:hypothetical protein NQZ68_038504 [Dissostichus eleginoides]